jgi:hypothetical protein
MNRKKIALVSMVTIGIATVLIAGAVFLASQNTPRDSDRALLGEAKSRLIQFDETVGERNDYTGICSSDEANILASVRMSFDCYDTNDAWAAGTQILDLYYLCLDSETEDGLVKRLENPLIPGSTSCPER